LTIFVQIWIKSRSRKGKRQRESDNGCDVISKFDILQNKLIRKIEIVSMLIWIQNVFKIKQNFKILKSNWLINLYNTTPL